MTKKVVVTTGEGHTREELVRLTQLLVVEGTKMVGAFAARHGLHHTDIEALTLVMVAQDRGSPMTAGALAGELGLTSGAITFVVDRLARAGHVTRVRDDTDRRKVLLHYSADGRALAEQFFDSHGRHTEDAMDQFTPAELEVARRFLAVTSAAMAAHRRSLGPEGHFPDEDVVAARPRSRASGATGVLEDR